jgi:hypothetical protein
MATPASSESNLTSEPEGDARRAQIAAGRRWDVLPKSARAARQGPVVKLQRVVWRGLPAASRMPPYKLLVSVAVYLVFAASVPLGLSVATRVAAL